MTKFGTARGLLTVLILVMSVWTFASDDEEEKLSDEIAQSTAMYLKDVWNKLKEKDPNISADRVLVAERGAAIVDKWINGPQKGLRVKVLNAKNKADTKTYRELSKDLFALEGAQTYLETRWAMLAGARQFLTDHTCYLTVRPPLVAKELTPMPISADDVTKSGDLLYGINDQDEMKLEQSTDDEKSFDSKDSMKKLVEKEAKELRDKYRSMIEVSLLKSTERDKDKKLKLNNQAITLSIKSITFHRPDGEKDASGKEIGPVTHSAQATAPTVDKIAHLGISVGGGQEPVAIDCSNSKPAAP